MTAPSSRGSLAPFGDFALLPAAYVGAAAWLFAMLSGLEIASLRLAAAVACAVLTAWAIYLLDRVKWRDAWLDPADPEAHPDRHALLWPRRRAIRIGCVAALAVATGLGAALGDSEAGVFGSWPAAIPAGAVAGAWIYAGRPRRERPRPKDRLVAKHAAVGVAIASLATTLGLVAAGGAATPWAVFAAIEDPLVALVATAIALRIAADAIWCDLDDAASDRRFGTASIPARLGPSAAWATGLVLTALGGGLAALVAPDGRGAAWAIAAVAGGAWLAVRRPPRVRDLVELRLVVEVAGLALLSAVARLP